MKENLIDRFNRNPLTFLLLFGLLIRLIAAFFSKGFLTLDDHFNFVVDADMISRGFPLPHDYKDSPLYPYFGAIMMMLGRALGNSSPDIEMLTIRLVQGILSLLVIYFVYKILESKTDKIQASIGGLMATSLFIIPIMAVHQFEEALCQIPVLVSIWIIRKQEEQNSFNPISITVAGILMGTAMILRFPMISFVGIFTLGLLFQKSRRRYFSAFLIGVLLIASAQAVINIFINGEFGYSYYRNFGWIFSNPNDLFHTSGYPAGPPWRYLLTLTAIFIPPFSILFLYSTFRGGRTFSLLGISTLSFFIAHSIIANKQERFLLPIIPVLIILGVAGMSKIKEWFMKKNLLKFYRGLWIYFWILNSILLTLTLFHYGKKDRIEPFVFIQSQHNATGIIIVQYDYEFLVPSYYLGNPTLPLFWFFERKNFNEEFQEVTVSKATINYIVFYGDSIEQDRITFEKAFGKRLTLEKEISPSLGDWIAHYFNPKYNRIKTASVFSLR
ncbi:MAG: glycosyltransferase family 39 protein [Ignavibacteriales bacterium]|nr:glycosyltransferase family 39 protein [Ignavibacteriales bacterium]